MNQVQAVESHFQLTKEREELLRETIAKGLTPDQFQLFVYTCNRTGLDPFLKQIYAIPRWDAKAGKNTMTIQVGIDGLRLVAERTGCYAPGPEPTFTFDAEGRVISATSYVKKMTRDGTWHTVAATAFYDEYAQKTKDGKVMGMWANMPKSQLAKCAEATALRKAFPAELSQVYSTDEMQQAHVPDQPVTTEQGDELERLLVQTSPEYQKKILSWIQAPPINGFSMHDLPGKLYDKSKAGILAAIDEFKASQNVYLEASGG